MTPDDLQNQVRADRESPILELREVTKRFGAVVANDRVSFTVHRGEILTILGENGAGKSTLLNVLAGMTAPDHGEVLLDGRPVVMRTPEEALQSGIGTVYQDFTLVPTLSVIENIVLGAASGIIVDLGIAEERLRQSFGDFGPGVPAHTLVRRLGVGQRQRVEILKVLFRNPRVLLLDEPTSVLTPTEIDNLFTLLRRLRDDGVAIILITHKLDEALEVSDRIVVLRSGRVVGEIGHDRLIGDDWTAKRRIIDLMFGDVATPPSTPITNGHDIRHEAAPVLLSLRSIDVRDDRGAMAVDGLSLDLLAGEIFGIAGADGNGQKELAETIAGQRAPVRGRVVVNGRDLTGKGIGAASRSGIGYVTDDRLGEGTVANGSVALNLILKRLASRPFCHRGRIDRAAIMREADRLIEEFNVRTVSADTPVYHLSGGNIQKLLLARELSSNPSILVCNKPTSGLDVRTARFVLDTLRTLANASKAVLILSSDLDETLRISDRIGVLYRGRIVGLFGRSEYDRATIGRLMLTGLPAPNADSLIRGMA